MGFSRRLIAVYVLWVFLHFLSAQFYPKYCAPMTGMGFILSPLLTPTPHCTAMRWMIYQGGLNISQIWIILGAIGLDALSVVKM
jgi:hypothetical protein